MPKNSLSDDIYGKQLDRLRMLKRFPEMPSARQDLIRVLRRITGERAFLENLMTFFVDNADRCPTPHELIERAGIMRANENKPLGDPSCERCGGSGYVHSVRRVKLPGMEPYDADCSERCTCAPAAPKKEVA